MEDVFRIAVYISYSDCLDLINSPDMRRFESSWTSLLPMAKLDVFEYIHLVYDFYNAAEQISEGTDLEEMENEKITVIGELQDSHLFNFPYQSTSIRIVFDFSIERTRKLSFRKLLTQPLTAKKKKGQTTKSQETAQERFRREKRTKA